MSIAQAIAGMSVDVTVERSVPGSFVDGLWQDGATSNVTIKASIQPMRPDEMLILPEGIREREALKLYTSEELFTADEKLKVEADVIIFENNRYEVQEVSRFKMNVLDHTKAIIVRESL